MYNKYVIDALIRNDGSSLFGSAERRQWYYRIAGAWRLTQEAWFHIPGIDELKLRYSVGYRRRPAALQRPVRDVQRERRA